MSRSGGSQHSECAGPRRLQLNRRVVRRPGKSWSSPIEGAPYDTNAHLVPVGSTHLYPGHRGAPHRRRAHTAGATAAACPDGLPEGVRWHPPKGKLLCRGKAGPGVLLLHQVNRQRNVWDDLAKRMAAAGINTLTLDMRGHGESGGTPYDKLTPAELQKEWRGRPADIDTALHYLASQPGVERDVIGVGGAGLLGVDNAVLAASRHPAEVKSLVLLSGETLRDGLQFLHQASQLPALFVVADDDEYPPTAEAMALLYVTSSNPGKKFVHYSAAKDAPWLWYEPIDVGKVPAPATTEPTCSRPIRSCPASSWSGS